MNTFILHINNHCRTKNTPSYTVAGIIEMMGEEAQMRFGISRCSPNDQFIKRIGRIKAEGRARSKDAILEKIPKNVINDGKLGKFFSERAFALHHNFKKWLDERDKKKTGRYMVVHSL